MFLSLYRYTSSYSSPYNPFHVGDKMEAPPDRWICLNTDATIDTYTSLGSISGVFCSSAGDWITGFHESIGITTPLQAELWAIYIGLQLAWIHSFDLLQIQSDSLQAIKLLNEANLNRDLFPLVRVISSLWCRSWYTEFFWVPC
ncbi:hypothetical protein F3Y22_tig00112738pilonHSYRG00210 [Hibiscus syriacus]|uniref:RNase H type-1 domain-containing protein n=1 Tax=Hibiscus syriacus TaxID=106335 RepID=A0A6A2Y3N2_HIBSY|nr:hypothetical protein F3Y22_tig00112738pilonHSYRG00210 [Hibiscus syriacus]